MDIEQITEARDRFFLYGANVTSLAERETTSCVCGAGITWGEQRMESGGRCSENCGHGYFCDGFGRITANKELKGHGRDILIGATFQLDAGAITPNDREFDLLSLAEPDNYVVIGLHMGDDTVLLSEVSENGMPLCIDESFDAGGRTFWTKKSNLVWVSDFPVLSEPDEECECPCCGEVSPVHNGLVHCAECQKTWQDIRETWKEGATAKWKEMSDGGAFEDYWEAERVKPYYWEGTEEEWADEIKRIERGAAGEEDFVFTVFQPRRVSRLYEVTVRAATEDAALAALAQIERDGELMERCGHTELCGEDEEIVPISGQGDFLSNADTEGGVYDGFSDVSGQRAFLWHRTEDGDILVPVSAKSAMVSKNWENVGVVIGREVSEVQHYAGPTVKWDKFQKDTALCVFWGDLKAGDIAPLASIGFTEVLFTFKNP